jgi:hypothetical protein
MVNHDELADRPPTPVEVARRALILSGVVCRASLESCPDKLYRRKTARSIRGWFEELGLWPYLEPDEEIIIRARFGKLPRPLRIRGTWFVEGLAILAWALRRCDFPPHDKTVGAVAVTNALDFLSPSAEDILSSPTLRDPPELEAAREWFYDAHCTLRQFLRGRDGQLASWIGQYLTVLGLDPGAVMYEGGLAIDCGPLSNATSERIERWESVICERHRAAIWLMGDAHPLYTEISVDT